MIANLTELIDSFANLNVLVVGEAMLDCYLEGGGDLKATARTMSVHVNTIKYRLGRIEALCGIRLRDPNDLVAATVASVVVRLLADGEDLLAFGNKRAPSFVDSTNPSRRRAATVRPLW